MLVKKSSLIINWIINLAGGAASIVAVLTFLQSQNIQVDKYLLSLSHTINNTLQLERVPIFIWILIFVLAIYLYLEKRRMNLVAGEFVDNFDHGLVNWEFGDESWRIQRGDEGYELSVTDSVDGGIVNFGLGWDNYEFSFECKLFDYNVGWIVRATDRENYIMIQLSNINNKITINPHYRVKSGWWFIRHDLKVSEKVAKMIRSCRWFKVKIVVFGNTIDVYLEGERVMNHHIPDPLRLEVPKRFKWKGEGRGKADVGETELLTLSYPSGKVGFRCLGDEHAHIRRVKVRPLFWTSKLL